MRRNPGHSRLGVRPLHARELRRAMDRQLARLAAFKGRALGGEGTATAAGTTAAWTCGSLAAVTALSCVLYACLPRPTSTLADCQSADFLPVQVQPSMATDCFAFSGTPALALSTEKAKDHSPSCCASPQGAPGCTSMAMAGNCTGVVCFLCPTVLCACTAVWWCMGCGMSVAVFGALWRAQSSAQKEAAPAHVLEVYLQREDGPLKLCSLPSSTTVAEVQRIFMGIRAPNLQNQDHDKIASFQESTYLKCKLKVLQPEQTLEECGIQQHATIRLMWRWGLPGGGACMSTPSVRVAPAVTADTRGGAAETGATAVSADTAGTAAQTAGRRNGGDMAPAASAETGEPAPTAQERSEAGRQSEVDPVEAEEARPDTEIRGAAPSASVAEWHAKPALDPSVRVAAVAPPAPVEDEPIYHNPDGQRPRLSFPARNLPHIIMAILRQFKEDLQCAATDGEGPIWPGGLPWADVKKMLSKEARVNFEGMPESEARDKCRQLLQEIADKEWRSITSHDLRKIVLLRADKARYCDIDFLQHLFACTMPEVAISYQWAAMVGQVHNGLLKQFDSTMEVLVWLDIFFNPQGASLETGDVLKITEKVYLAADLHVLIVHEGAEMHQVLQRAWIMLEIAVRAASDKSMVILVDLSGQTKDYFSKAMMITRR